jgi:hypothetical protein
MYTLENLKPINTVFDCEHRLNQSDVEMVNRYAARIESTRGENPRPGDIIEYTDEYGDYCRDAHIVTADSGTGRCTVRIHSYVPIVYRNDDHQKEGFYCTGGGVLTFVDAAALTYVGKREKLFAAFSHHCILPGHSAVYFKTLVNVWEYVAPAQKYPGYSTKGWHKQYITYVKEPTDNSPYHYYGSFSAGIAFKNDTELKLWKNTYRAVEFPGSDPNHSVLFLYRNNDRLISRDEWDALSLPLDTRFVNGIVHVKAAYDDGAHIVTAYRFTNSGYLDSRKFGPYE